MYIIKHCVWIWRWSNIDKSHKPFFVNNRGQRRMIHQASSAMFYSDAEIFPNLTEHGRAPREKCPIVKLGSVAFAVCLQHFRRVDFRICRNRQELDPRPFFFSETDLCLAQSGCDQRANIDTGGICECHDNHFASELFEIKMRAILIAKCETFDRSVRNAPLGTSLRDLSGHAHASSDHECDRQKKNQISRKTVVH